MDIDKVCYTILNYNDAFTTMSLVGEIREYSCPGSIVVVDNCSTDGSWEQFKAFRGLDRVHVLHAKGNGGYGGGNQAGIDHAVTYLEVGCIIIASPDIHVRACCIEWVELALDGVPEAVMISARVTSSEDGDPFSC